MSHFIWVRRIGLGLLAGAALFAQQTPAEYTVKNADAPAEVKEALRARVTEFFNYHVGPTNRRSIDMVAEDTKDYYYGSGKVNLLGFTIKDFDFTPDLQKAYVKLDMRQIWEVQDMSTEVTQPSGTTWKIEDGKWVWFLDVQNVAGVWRTPMGPSAAPPPKTDKPTIQTNADGTLFIPSDFAKPERLQEQAQAILAQSGLDKDTVTLTYGEAGEASVKFHNGVRGQVSLKLYGDPRIPGLTVKLDKNDLFANEEGTVTFQYNPPADLAMMPGGTEHTLKLELIPFNQMHPIRLIMRPAKQKQ